MDYLPPILKHYNFSLQPSHSELIKLDSVKDRLYPGAHIATSNPYEHFHHGIVVDVDKPDLTIIHFWGKEKDQSRIQTTNLPIFLAGGVDNLGKKTRDLYLIDYEDDSLIKQRETVDRAKEMLGKGEEIIYDLGTCNCESFARFCRTKLWQSEQIEKLKELFVEKAPEIYDRVKHADDKNRRQIRTLMNVIPVQALAPSERIVYDQLCGDLIPSDQIE